MDVLDREVQTSKQPVKVIVPFETDQKFFIPAPENKNVGAVYIITKRVIDVVVSFMGLAVCCIPMLLVAALVKLSSKGPVIYAQERLGLNGKPFMMHKFRTMVDNAETNGAQWSDGDDDPRITKIGRIMRKLRIDELPQLWDILKGDMSFVGPRPERGIFYDEFDKYIEGFRHRLCVTPGLTGLAQVSGGYDLRPEEKAMYDIEYINNRSLLMDMKIFMKTFYVIITHEGAK